MENRFKLRISRIFKSSFGSCSSKNVTDAIERPVFVAGDRQHYQLVELFSPKPRPFPSICRPKWPETKRPQNDFVFNRDLFPRRKVSDRNSLLAPSVESLKCPPASSISPQKTISQFRNYESKPKQRKRSSEKAKLKNKKSDFVEFKPSEAGKYNGLFSSNDDDDDRTTSFSSRSLSSESSEPFRRNRAHYPKKSSKPRRRSAATKDFDMGVLPLQGKVKDSFAVVKSSTDPYNDFRTSMVEMVIERQIFSAKDLQNLLQSFLLLNSYHHHRVIIQVFAEIWRTLFPTWS